MLCFIAVQFGDLHPRRREGILGGERALRWVRRHPWRVAAGAALVFSLLAGTLVSLLLWRSAEANRQTAEASSERATDLAAAERLTGYVSTMGAALAARERHDFSRARQLNGEASPEEAFDRRWARAVYDNALATLHARLKSRGREPQFLMLSGLLNGRGTAKYQEIAVSLGMSEGAVKQSGLEMRREFGGVLRDEIRRTVVEEAQVDGEIRYLIGLLRD